MRWICQVTFRVVRGVVMALIEKYHKTVAVSKKTGFRLVGVALLL